MGAGHFGRWLAVQGSGCSGWRAAALGSSNRAVP